MIRVGVVGLGHVAAHHIAAIERSSEFELVSGCDPDSARHSLLPTRARAFDDIRGLLEGSSLDVVVVASPNRLHVEHGILAMEKGLWLMIEKPLAESRAAFEAFSATKAELGGKCTMALHAAFGREVEWLARNPERTVDGIKRFACEFDDPYVVNGRLQRGAESLGGAWLDSGINALSVVARFVSVDSMGVSTARMIRDDSVPCTEVEAHVEFQARSSGAIGSIHTSWVKNRDRKVTTLMTSDADRSIVLHHSAQSVILREGDVERELFAGENGLPRLTNHYIGVFGDLAVQMQAGDDNFVYGARLHDLFYRAAVAESGKGNLSGNSP